MPDVDSLYADCPGVRKIVFSWIFPVCLLGTMITFLLLLLSLASVETVTIKRRDFKIMVNETVNKEIIDVIPRGCRCAEISNDQTLLKLQRCCRLQKCCYHSIHVSVCFRYSPHHSYDYSDGTITCGTKQYMTGCAGKTCECDRETAMCLTREEDPHTCRVTIRPCRVIKEEGMSPFLNILNGRK
ncbi:acidic phospholipase A2-like isoform 2-T2 [Anomaloglossus baeobatrachus]|uniref:acidic phospholipase A2-like isoform X2 n=1 Tax=Anomaloglossus baeobatrachus TaxID=238106 RepID=UPI003F4FEB9C